MTAIVTSPRRAGETLKSGSSPTSRGRATTGTTAISARASRSTPICLSGAGSLIGAGPTRRSPATTSSTRWKEQRLVRRAGPRRGDGDAHQYARGIRQRGPGRARRALHHRAATLAGAVRRHLRARRHQARGRRDSRTAAHRRRCSTTLRALSARRSTACCITSAGHATRSPPSSETLGCARAEQADKSLEFIDHPLWRTYVFCYSGGEALLGAWCAAAGDIDAQRKRFFRLLTEQLTPSGMAADLERRPDLVGAHKKPPNTLNLSVKPLERAEVRAYTPSHPPGGPCQLRQPNCRLFRMWREGRGNGEGISLAVKSKPAAELDEAWLRSSI